MELVIELDPVVGVGELATGDLYICEFKRVSTTRGLEIAAVERGEFLWLPCQAVCGEHKHVHAMNPI